ncbi:MAG: hypothetical protein R3F56_01965 [Planctomycetota bacterium]
MRACSLLLFPLVACAQAPQREASPPPVEIAPALANTVDAYDAAGRVQLSEQKPLELNGLHNVFRLSPNIVSGSEPEGEAAFAELARLGIKTILSVDGAAPAAEVAKKHGLRYVHVPIEYSGINEDEMLRIAKTFREQGGPFYVHCFHGKHRGPAAAAVGRCVLDGASREQAIAEMRQWMGTAPQYQGLYKTIATQEIPATETTEKYAFDFPQVCRPTGLVAGMVAIGRAFDNLKALAKRDFASDPEHPDVDALNEAGKLADQFAYLKKMDPPAVAKGKTDFPGWLADAWRDADALETAIGHMGKGPDNLAKAKDLVKAVSNACSSCHKVYRD